MEDTVVTAIVCGIFGALLLALVTSDYFKHRRRVAASVNLQAEPDAK